MSHIYDPLSRIDVPPPRHDVESDSEEDFSEDENELLTSAGESSSASAPHLSFSPASLPNKAGSQAVTVLVGQAGEGVARAQGFTEEGRIDWMGRQVGSWAAQGEGTCLLLYPGSAVTENISELAELVKMLLKKVGGNSLTLVDQYNATLYIDTDPSVATTTSSSSAPVRYLSSSSGPTSTASYLPTPTHSFAPPNYLSHPTHTVSSLLVQEAVYAGIPTQVILLPSTAQQARPHTRLVSRKRKSRKRRPQGLQGLTLEEEFPSDDDEEEEEVQDEVDPAPLQVDLIGLKSTGAAGPPMAAFVESRRKMAARRRAVASGMYV